MLAFSVGAAGVALAADSAPSHDDFGQYLVDHQGALAPFFAQNGSEIFRHAVPALMGMLGWIFLLTMLLGWGVDVLLSRGYAALCAPALADWKRSIFYATGRLFLSFLYACLMGLIIVLVLGLTHATLIIPGVLVLLGLVALAAQIVWILYLFRTSFGISLLFYVALLVVHSIAAFFIAQPVLAARASPAMTNFVDQAVTPRLQADARVDRQQLAQINDGRDSAQMQVADCRAQIAQDTAEANRLTREIEEKKNSDVYTFSQIVKQRAQGDLKGARDQLAAFSIRFAGSPLDAAARAQLAAVIDQMAVEEASRRQQQADSDRATAQARADLFARVAQGKVSLSEMRQTLLGKSRAQVSDLLGPPSGTGSDQWSYSRQMILDPLTNQKSGLTVYFNQGAVQSVDYNRGGTP